MPQKLTNLVTTGEMRNTISTPSGDDVATSRSSSGRAAPAAVTSPSREQRRHRTKGTQNRRREAVVPDSTITMEKRRAERQLEMARRVSESPQQARHGPPSPQHCSLQLRSRTTGPAQKRKVRTESREPGHDGNHNAEVLVESPLTEERNTPTPSRASRAPNTARQMPIARQGMPSDDLKPGIVMEDADQEKWVVRTLFGGQPATAIKETNESVVREADELVESMLASLHRTDEHM